MKRVVLILLIFFLTQQVSFCAPKKMIPTNSGKESLPNIFIYTIPDSEPENVNEKPEMYTSIKESEEKQMVFETDEYSEYDSSNDEIVLNATVLKGYAQFIEDSDEIYLKDDNDNYVLNIKTPQKISASKGLNLKPKESKPLIKYKEAEYVIAPGAVKSSAKIGDFIVGAKYNNEVDNIAMLETETSLFTKYEKNKFALSSSVTKSLNTTYSQDYSTFSIAPELKLNNRLSLKNVFSADVTRNRRSAKLILSLNPFKDKERMFFEFGLKETYYMDSEKTTTQFSFSTQFKL